MNFLYFVCRKKVKSNLQFMRQILIIIFLTVFKTFILQSEESSNDFERAKHVSNLVIAEKRYIDDINASQEVSYPIGLVAEGKELEYAILLDRDEVNKQSSLLSAYMLFTVPQSGDTLGFVAHNIALDEEGGLAGDIVLTLIKSVKIKLGQDIQLEILGGTNGSNVIFGCKGFKSMTINAQLELSSETFVRENPVTGQVLSDKITTQFSVTLTDWHDLMVSISLPSFQLKSLPGFGFEIQDATLDLSDFVNPTGAELPKSYNNFFPENQKNLWQGIFLRSFIMRLPPEFSKKNSSNTSGTRTALYASNLFIDDLGVSGILGADGLLLLNEGDMNGWSFSVDRFDLQLEMSSLASASFKGKLQIPMLDSVLLYRALIGVDGNYVFSVTTTQKQSFNLWAADMQLDPNSTITIEVSNGKFKPYARLNGSLTVNADISGSKRSENKESNLSLVAIKFENLELQTEKPNIKGGIFSLGSAKARQSMANFPLQIDSIFVAFNENAATLGVKIRLGLLSESEGGISAGGIIKVYAEHVYEAQRDFWKYKNLEIGMMTLDASLSAFKFKGTLQFFKDDPVFGKGFQGNVYAGFTIGQAGIEFSANAMFGKSTTYKYWYFDALATVSTGIPIFPGLAIYGFGGGAYYHMKQMGTTSAGQIGLGITNSGLIYRPNDSIFLGMKAMVVLGTSPSKEIFNSDITLEIAFNNKMGIKYINFNGNGYFITPPVTIAADDIKKGALTMGSGGSTGSSSSGASRSSIMARVNINYDISNQTLYGNLSVYMSVGGVIRGTGPNNLAGEAEMYFSSDDWYIYIGKPNAPVGITMANLLQTSSYFMMGTKILESPPPPTQISDILRNPQYATYMDDLNNIGNCSGIAFGSRLQMNTGDITYLMFYGKLDAGIGFDVALKNYGNIRCAGSNSVIGINGWYANGQAYAYLQGKIGIRVKIFKFEKKATIAEGGMATILQAQMPNPLYMQGAVGGYFSVLDGLVKGHFDFSFTLGEKCEIVGGSPLDNINVIAKLTPEENATEVDVFTSPQVVFNYTIDSPFEMVDIENKKHTYRIKLDYFNLYDGSNILQASSRWSEDKKTLVLLPSDILPGSKKLSLKVKVVFEEYRNYQWEVVREDGVPLFEEQTVSFTTGKAPDYIPNNNITYSYPLINQLNYYINESTEGYVQLRQGQDYLFENPYMISKGRFTVLSTGQSFEFDVSYNFENNVLTFTRPNNLPTGQIMKFELIRRPKNISERLDANVRQNTERLNNAGSSQIDVTTRTAEGVIRTAKDKIILSMHFRTSEFKTVKEKFANIDNKNCWFMSTRVNVAYLLPEFTINEGFDKYEILGATDDFKPLFYFEADLSDNKWYEENFYKYVYRDYPINSTLTINDPYGIPPVKAIYIMQLNRDLLLDETSINNLNFDYTKGGNKGLVYDLANYMDLDYHSLRELIVKYYWNNLNDKMKNVLQCKTVFYYKGNYKINVFYHLPGKNAPNSQFQIIIKNPFQL